MDQYAGQGVSNSVQRRGTAYDWVSGVSYICSEPFTWRPKC